MAGADDDDDEPRPDTGQATKMLERLRDMSDADPADHYHHLDDFNDEGAELVEKLQDAGVDASYMVASSYPGFGRHDPFAGLGPDPKGYTTDTTAYVDDQERPGFIDLDEIPDDDDIIKYNDSRSRPPQGPRHGAATLGDHGGFSQGVPEAVTHSAPFGGEGYGWEGELSPSSRPVTGSYYGGLGDIAKGVVNTVKQSPIGQVYRDYQNSPGGKALGYATTTSLVRKDDPWQAGGPLDSTHAFEQAGVAPSQSADDDFDRTGSYHYGQPSGGSGMPTMADWNAATGQAVIEDLHNTRGPGGGPLLPRLPGPPRPSRGQPSFGRPTPEPPPPSHGEPIPAHVPVGEFPSTWSQHDIEEYKKHERRAGYRQAGDPYEYVDYITGHGSDDPYDPDYNYDARPHHGPHPPRDHPSEQPWFTASYRYADEDDGDDGSDGGSGTPTSSDWSNASGQGVMQAITNALPGGGGGGLPGGLGGGAGEAGEAAEGAGALEELAPLALAASVRRAGRGGAPIRYDPGARQQGRRVQAMGPMPEDFGNDGDPDMADYGAPDGGDIVANFQRSAAAGDIYSQNSYGGGDDDIATNARAFLRTAGRKFTHEEQRMLEAEAHPLGARNLPTDEDLEGTHYLLGL